MSSTPLTYYQDKMGKTQAHVLTFAWEITGAKAVSETIKGMPVLYSFDALTQAQIDAFLGSSSEFTLAQFDATSMGTDAFGGIIDMKGQASDISYIHSHCNLDPTADGALINSDAKVSALSDSTLADNIEVAVSSAGNIAFKQTVTGLDAATDGLILVTIGWIAQ